ncbi:hypothetical protein QOZ80_6BG0493310 [Eleusine coracana subsp. coracana]|nr:hypothetical protein QOZ80_6BG0493310 [Eleusine coracana subsp. coracana]
MGSCVSRSPPPASAAPPELGRVAKVVGLDGPMAKFDSPISAREALLASGGGRHRLAQSPPCFLCSADELGFDAPARALAAEEPLQPGQLYFVLPASALRRPLSGQDMAALAVKAATALAVQAGLAGAGVSSPSRRKSRGDGEAGKLRTKTARVARLAVALTGSKDSSQSSEGASWKHKHQGYEYDSGRTVGKTRHGVGRGARRSRADVQKLSAIAEDTE